MNATVQKEIDKQKQRGKDRVKQTAEVFTPMDLCLRMVNKIPLDKLKDPTTTYLDNSCGDGNFLVTLLQVLTEEYNHPRDQVLNTQLYGVDLMPDNIATVKERLGIQPGTPAWDHVVCADGLTYDYEFKSQSAI